MHHTPLAGGAGRVGGKSNGSRARGVPWRRLVRAGSAGSSLHTLRYALVASRQLLCARARAGAILPLLEALRGQLVFSGLAPGKASERLDRLVLTTVHYGFNFRNQEDILILQVGHLKVVGLSGAPQAMRSVAWHTPCVGGAEAEGWIVAGCIPNGKRVLKLEG